MRVPLSVVLCSALTAAALGLVFAYVDLKPRVDQHFFFSSEDPQFQEEREIARIFPQPPQIIMAVKGDPRSPAYVRRIGRLSDDLAALPEVFSIQSLTRGPDDLEDAMKSPLWRRILIAEDGEASLISIFIKDVDFETLVPVIEAIGARYHAADFQVMISGAPYMVELIRRRLYDDLRIFSVVTFAVFSVALLFVFGSLWIVGGTVVSCLNASAVTLLLFRWARIDIGFLTANLSTIVFVLTLSHILFLTASWKQLFEEARARHADPAWEAARATLQAAFWSTCTAMLGFLTLLFVPAKALRQLGIAGSIGTLVSFAACYAIFPWFLSRQMIKPESLKRMLLRRSRVDLFFRKNFVPVLIALIALVVLSFVGLGKLNTDPSLFAYFKKGSDLRAGLEYIDRNGGSNPFYLVVAPAEEGGKFNSSQAYRRLWDLHLALERDPAIGQAISLPTVLAEAKRSILTYFLTTEWLLDILASPRYGEVAKYFVTEDRTKALFFLRMKEQTRGEPRAEVVERVKSIVRAEGFDPHLAGGVYVLQGRLSKLVTSSLLSGSVLLNAVFLAIAWFISRSLKVSLAMVGALYFVPLVMVGFLGHLRVPLDVISAPAANVAIGLGVDSMIHMIMRVRGTGNSGGGAEYWAKARSHLWEPILWSTFVVGAGFSVFAFSNFPPTQRFGFSVVLGTALAPFGALFLLPWLAQMKMPSWLKPPSQVSQENDTIKQQKNKVAGV